MTALLERELIGWRAHAHVDKWDQDQTEWTARKSGILAPRAAHFIALRVAPADVADQADNLLTTAGLNRLTSLAEAAGGQGFTATAVRLGVGNGVGTAAIGDTDLSAASGAGNRQFYTMDSTFPTQSNGVMTFKSSFLTADANFVWNEWGLDVGAPTVANGTTVAALLLNHKTSAALGTKTTGTWALTVTITIA